MGRNDLTKPRKSGVGKLFLGIFLGFLLCLGIIFGVGWYAYKNVSIQWINKTFKTDINVSDEVNNKTIEELILSASGALNNIDTYTLNDLKKDFGLSVDDKLMGIDITDLKDVPIKEISNKAQDKFSNISADELKDVVDLTDMNLILNKTNTYYVYGDKLYTDELHTKEVNKNDISYKLTSTTVEIKGQTRTIEAGKVSFELRYLPLTKAFGDFMNTMGDKITVGELVDKENGFGVELPEYLHNTSEKRAKTINELSDVVNNLYLAEFLGYTISGDEVTDKTGNTITGIVAKLAKKTIDQLTNVEQIVNESTIAEVMGYTIESGKYYYFDAGVKKEVTGIMKTLAGVQVQNLTNRVNNLTMLEALDYTVTGTGSNKVYKDSSNNVVTGILTIIDLENTQVNNISSAFQDAVTTTLLRDLVAAGVINISAEDLEIQISGSYTYNGTDLSGCLLGDLTLNQAVYVFVEILKTPT